MLLSVVSTTLTSRTRLFPADVHRAVSEARMVCSKSAGRECAAAWDCVEELSNELARQAWEEQEAKGKVSPAKGGSRVRAHSLVLGDVRADTWPQEGLQHQQRFRLLQQ